jgi:hypothetical protein
MHKIPLFYPGVSLHSGILQSACAGASLDAPGEVVHGEPEEAAWGGVPGMQATCMSFTGKTLFSIASGTYGGTITSGIDGLVDK